MPPFALLMFIDQLKKKKKQRFSSASLIVISPSSYIEIAI